MTALLIRFPLTAVLLSILLFPVLIKVLRDRGIFASQGSRRLHNDQRPSMGGLAIFATATITIFIWTSFSELIPYKGLSISLIIMLIIGLRDDLLELTPATKFVSQFVPVVFLVLLQNTRLTSTYTLFAYDFSTPEIWIVTVLSILVITNSFNLIDGVDGLAGSLGALSLLTFGIWFTLTGTITLAQVALSFIGGIVGFLVYNWSPSKIFMGDTGSLIVGLLCAFMAVTFLNANDTLESGSPYHFGNAVTFAISTLGVPIFDTVRVSIIRVSRLKSPFHADKNHLHHVLLRAGLGHGGTTIALTLLNVFFVALAIVFRNLPDLLCLFIVVAICVVIHFGLVWKTRRRTMRRSHLISTEGNEGQDRLRLEKD